MNAAEQLFIKQGFYKTTSKQIVRYADVSIGSFYGYFHDKKDVFIAVVWEHIQHTVAAMKAYLDKQDRSHDLREVASSLIALTMEHLSPGLFREITILRYHDPDIGRLQEKTFRSIYELLIPWRTSLGNQLRVKDVEAGLEMLIMAVMDIIHVTTTYTHNIQQERIINELTDMIVRYLVGDSQGSA
ncbi:MAG: TetR/AcrR family transcriptional regulator [Syntrophaceae bacterium]